MRVTRVRYAGGARRVRAPVRARNLVTLVNAAIRAVTDTPGLADAPRLDRAAAGQTTRRAVTGRLREATERVSGEELRGGNRDDLAVIAVKGRRLRSTLFITSVDQVSSEGVQSRAKPHCSKESLPPRWRPKTANDNGVGPA